MNRRKFMFAGLGAGALLAGIAAWMRLAGRGGSHDDYFHVLNRELKANGPMCPVLLIDPDRLDHNIDVVMRSARRGGKHLRLVEKSLLSPGLLAYIARRTGTRWLMSFHQPFLNHDAVAFPDADILLGKPSPARSAGLLYREHKGTLDLVRQLQWLIDTSQRLHQYLTLAQGLGIRTRANIELDVGLHRDGMTDQAALDELLAPIMAHPQHLEFTGFMGYDPFVEMGVPDTLGSSEELFAEVMALYQGHVNFARQRLAALWTSQLTLNIAGSPSYRVREKETLSNEVPVSAAVLKPSHYDLMSLAKHMPAAYIAIPALRSTGVVQIPALDGKSRLFSWWDPNQRGTFFIYGGSWMADFTLPEGLRSSGICEHSSNQEMINGSSSVGLEADDQVFLWPIQSGSVLLQFGDLLALRGGRIIERWPIYVQDAWRSSQSMAAARR